MTSTPSHRCEVYCANGKAVVEGDTTITWEHEGVQHTESLSSDRPEIEVMLDHFCRRVVGGLIPVPNIEDVQRALSIVQAANESDVAGHSIPLC